jgi:uncharacterized membrane protein
MTWYRRSVAIFALTFVALGVALVAKTAATGGGSSGYMIGVLFVAVGAGRMYLLRRR